VLFCNNRVATLTRTLGSYCERVEYSLTNLSFASFNALYLVLMYEKNSQNSIFDTAPYDPVHLMVPKTRLLPQNGNSSEYCYGHEKAVTIVLIGFTKHYWKLL